MRHVAIQRIGACLFALSSLAGAGLAVARDAVSAESPFDRAESAEIDRLVRDVCRRDIVLLGEDANHGSGRTLEIKVELVKRLVTRCGFGAVVFESALYDVLDYERAVADGAATAQRFTDAAGQLWFRAEEAKPLAAFLHAEATAGRVRVGGIDVQPLGITAHFSRRALGTALSGVLDGERAADCRIEFDRHHRWDYDDARPFDDAAQRRLRACLDDVRAALAAHGADAPATLVAMASAYARYLGMAMDGDGDQRDLGMFEALLWHRDRWPKGTRIVVWSAGVHVAKQLNGVAPTMHPLGAYVHERFGDRAAAIGFTALSGRFGPGGTIASLSLPEAPAAALERAVLGERGLRYLDRRRLEKLGTAPARPINYRIVHAARWATIFDGLMVLREERPYTPRGEEPARPDPQR